MRRALFLVPVLVALGASGAQAGSGPEPVLHELIPADAQDDLALHAVTDGDMPAAIQTPSGVVRAPDLRKPPGASESTYDQQRHPAADVPDDASFSPDRNTKRPDVLPYDDPFTPSTAPFKRLAAYDSVAADYSLHVKNPRRDPLPQRGAPGAEGAEEQFFADLVVDVKPGQAVRIPSVGPGARIVRARLAEGARDVPFALQHDGADNWFITGNAAVKARLVMQITIARATFGGDFGNPRWADFPAPDKLPANVAAAAQVVAAHIGVNRATMQPREVVTRLVAYYRSFADSDEPPRGHNDIYLDLALSQKGVCRHRAFAFLVTALSLGIPTRMVVNEAHAWIEVLDPGVAPPLWRRIDLGGAGRALGGTLPDRVAYEPPPDPFAWPSGATRGDDLADRARAASHGGGAGGANGSSASGAGGTGQPGEPGGAASAASSAGGGAGASTPNGPSSGVRPGGSSASGGPGAAGSSESQGDEPPLDPLTGLPASSAAKDDRPRSTLSLTVTDGADARRGRPLRVHGQVSAEGESCSNVIVDVVLRDVAAQRGGPRSFELGIGALATNAQGVFEGALVVPSSVPLGDYEVRARTSGDTRCGPGGTSAPGGGK